jgi:hypothetical protein
MTLNPAQLLRSLGAVLRPAGAPDQAAAPRPTEGPGFEQLLRDAQSGSVASGLPVRVSSQAGVSLSPTQLARLSDAADRAEAAGAGRALIMIDGMALTMDVGTRTITGKADATSTKVLNGVDTVVTVANEAGQVPGQIPLPSPGAQNASLLKILAARKPGGSVSA